MNCFTTALFPVRLGPEVREFLLSHQHDTTINFIITFPYNVLCDWLKQRTLSENKERVNDIKLAFKFLPGNFDKFDTN